MANGNGDLNPFGSLPPWLRGLLTILLQQGVAVAIAIFLVWWISTRVLVNQDLILSEIRSHRVDTALAGKTMTDFAMGQQEMQRSLVMLQLQTCLNTASDNQQRQECAKAAR